MNLRGVLFSFMIFTGLLSFAQRQSYSSINKKAIKTYEEALNKFELRYFGEALPLLDKVIKKDPLFIEAYGVKSTIYAQKGDYLKAISELERGLGVNPDYMPFLHLDLAQLYFKTAQYSRGSDQSNFYLKKYQPKTKLKGKAERVLASCKFSIEALKNPVKIEPQNLGPNINSDLKEYLPVLSVDMTTLIFTRTIPDSRSIDKFQEDFYAAFKYDDNWRRAFNIGAPLNTVVNEGGHSLTADGNTMFFTICPDIGVGYGAGRNGYGSCDIFVTFLRNGKWTTPKNLGPKVNHKSHDAQPSMSSDGRSLYFSSTRSGGYGENDIYVTYLTKSGWSIPQNLGGIINTPGREEGVFIHPDNQTLYFSSNGHPGLGENDLFISKRQTDGSWGKPINLGFPINTSKNDFDFTVDAMGEYAYLTSDRDGGFGDWDIYKFRLPDYLKPKPVTYMTGKTFDNENKRPLEARFELIELEGGEKIVESTANLNGKFLVCLPYGKEYALNAVYEGYLFYSENFKLNKSADFKPIEKDVPLQPIKIGGKVILKNIFFDVNQYDLKSESKAELGKLKEFLSKNSSLKIEIGGHTDDQGSKSYNLELSRNRAKAVSDWLITNKISKNRLSYKGYADNEPIMSNDSLEGRSRNRRTEFKITGR
jgi:outer membrane protein OmpA-like peptidoglycan-associated protein